MKTRDVAYLLTSSGQDIPCHVFPHTPPYTMASVSDFLVVDLIPLPEQAESRYSVLAGATGNAKQRWRARIAAQKLAKKQAYLQFIQRKKELYRRRRFRHFDADIRAQLRQEEEEIKENHLVLFTSKELSAAWRERASAVHERKRTREKLRRLRDEQVHGCGSDSGEEPEWIDLPAFRGDSRRHHFNAGRIYRHWSQNRKWKKHMSRQARASRKAERHD